MHRFPSLTVCTQSYITIFCYMIFWPHTSDISIFPGKFAQLPALSKALIKIFILDNSNFSIPNLNHLTFKKCRNNFRLTGILNLTYLTIVSIMFKKYNVHVFFDNITNEYVQHFGRLNFTFWARLCRHFLLEEVFHIFIIL